MLWKRGDFIEVSSENLGVIRGAADRDMGYNGYAEFGVILARPLNLNQPVVLFNLTYVDVKVLFVADVAREKV